MQWEKNKKNKFYYNIVFLKWYLSEKNLLLRQQTDRIQSFAVLNGFEIKLSTGILFFNDIFFFLLKPCVNV